MQFVGSAPLSNLSVKRGSGTHGDELLDRYDTAHPVRDHSFGIAMGSSIDPRPNPVAVFRFDAVESKATLAWAIAGERGR